VTEIGREVEMRETVLKVAFMSFLTLLVVALPLISACGGDDEEDITPTPTAEVTPTPMPTSTSIPTPTPSPTTEPTVAAELNFYRDPNHPEGYQNPLPHLSIPQHPFLAPNGRSNMHNDAYMTDTYEVGGPLGLNPEVIYQSYADGPNSCVSISFDSKDRILTTSTQMLGFSILLLDPETLDIIAPYPLPPRDPTDPLFPFGDTSGAVYFVLDNQDRVLLTDTENAIQIIQYNDEAGGFQQLNRYDLSNHVVLMGSPARDHIQMTIPDWGGKLLWFTTRYGKVGTVDPDTGEVHTIELDGEEFQNSFAVGEDGVYVISDHAMYRFNADEDGSPVTDWRTEYDRGTRVKPSNFNQGSGTTPQLFGDLVAIGDNAEPRMNILFLKRSDGTEVCRIPVFDEGQSTTENALPGLVREGANGTEYSVIVDNNYGILRDNVWKPGRCWTEHAGGLIRLDLIADGSGGYTCQEVWRSPEKSSQVLPKISLANGLVYFYTYELLPDDDYGWYLTVVDFETGETAFRIPTGAGLEYANFGQPLILGPDGKTAYLGTMQGLVRIRDRPSE
jgi:hypothetical protein